MDNDNDNDNIVIEINSSNISEITEKINIIMRQTDYTEEIAKQKMKECDNDHIKVIKNYFGITEKINSKPKSINQEIYKQIRTKLDASIVDYNKKQEIKLQNEIDNFSKNI